MQSFSFNYNKSLRNYSLWFKISQRGYYLAFLLRSFGIPTNPNSNLHHHMCINSHIDNSQPNIQFIIVFYRYLFKSPSPFRVQRGGYLDFLTLNPLTGTIVSRLWVPCTNIRAGESLRGHFALIMSDFESPKGDKCQSVVGSLH